MTGTFDDWAKSVQLEKKDDIFEKEVTLPKDEKALYKVSRTFLVITRAWAYRADGQIRPRLVEV